VAPNTPLRLIAPHLVEAVGWHGSKPGTELEVAFFKSLNTKKSEDAVYDLSEPIENIGFEVLDPAIIPTYASVTAQARLGQEGFSTLPCVNNRGKKTTMKLVALFLRGGFSITEVSPKPRTRASLPAPRLRSSSVPDIPEHVKDHSRR
jgi:hypothetical protein